MLNSVLPLLQFYSSHQFSLIPSMCVKVFNHKNPELWKELLQPPRWFHSSRHECLWNGLLDIGLPGIGTLLIPWDTRLPMGRFIRRTNLIVGDKRLTYFHPTWWGRSLAYTLCWQSDLLVLSTQWPVEIYRFIQIRKINSTRGWVEIFGFWSLCREFKLLRIYLQLI